MLLFNCTDESETTPNAASGDADDIDQPLDEKENHVIAASAETEPEPDKVEEDLSLSESYLEITEN